MRKLFLGSLIAIASFADVTKTGNIVTDNDTGLMWQDEIFIPKIHWEYAVGYCNNVVIDNLAGWRLPSLNELMTIVDQSNFDPAIKDGFDYVESDDYWTSSTNYNNTTAFYVNFYNGYIYDAPKSVINNVRCVRGGDGSNLTRAGNIVTDHDTGLKWQDQANTEKRYWADAMNYCNQLSLDGQTNWRLPSLNELKTIVDKSKYNPAIKGDVFQYVETSSYWTSTANTSDTAFYINFNDGYVSYAGKTVLKPNVRCVK